MFCDACRLEMEPGAALRCIPRDGSPAVALHRPSVRGECLAWAGHRGQTTIELMDCAAAREHDRSAAPANPAFVPRGNQVNDYIHARLQRRAAREGA